MPQRGLLARQPRVELQVRSASLYLRQLS